MADTSIISISTPFSFTLTVPNISKLNNIFSDEYIIEDTPWKIRVFKKTLDSKQYLCIHLKCSTKNKPPNWSHAAFASFKLLSFGQNVDAIKEGSTAPTVFNSLMDEIGVDFLEWNDLFNARNKCVENDTIKFKIKIEADSNDVDKSIMKSERLGEYCECSGLAKFRLTVTNIENLVAVRASQFILRDSPWYFTVLKDSSHKLGIRLTGLTRRSNSADVSCEAKVSVKLISSNIGVKPIDRTFSTVFKTKKHGKNFTMNLISWEELLKLENGFVQNGSITLEVEIKAEKPNDVVSSAQKRSASETTVSKVPKIECAICKKAIINQDTSCIPCGHLFCTPCIENAIQFRKICPIFSCSAKVPWNSLRRMRLTM